MLRHYTCSTRNATCTLRDAQAMLPGLRADGYSVVYIVWPVSASPDSLFEGFGAFDYMAVDPKLGTDADWDDFVAAAHALDMVVVADFNPSYFWTAAPAFKRAVADVRRRCAAVDLRFMTFEEIGRRALKVPPRPP